MSTHDKKLRVLWFSITPGLSNHPQLMSFGGGGWIASIQRGVQRLPDVELGFVFYTDGQMAPFIDENTHYYPVRRLGYSKKTRMLNRIMGRTEYEENLPRFLEIIKDFKPDIIQIYGTEFPFGLIVKHVQDIPILVFVQGNLTVYEKKYFSGFNMPGLFRQIRSGYPFFGADYHIWKKRVKIEQEIMKNTKYIGGRTDWDRRICRILAPDARYFVLDDALREPFFHIKWAPPHNEVPVFFTTSSPVMYKGLETIIDTARLLMENKFKFTWLVAGLKEEQAFVQMVKKLRAVDSFEALNIRLAGNLSADDLAKNLQQADAFVQVSHIENSPNSLCEAMLVGTPAITSLAGGTLDLIQDGITGTVVQNGDPYALAGAMIELTEQPERSIRMAGAAQQAARKKHDIARIMDQLMAVYSEIIRDHAGQKGGRQTVVQSPVVTGAGAL